MGLLLLLTSLSRGFGPNPNFPPPPPHLDHSLCNASVVNTLIDEKWLKVNQKCNNNNPFAVSQANDSYVGQPFGCGCYFKAIELNATSWDRDSVNGVCRFFSETCDKVAAPNFEAGNIIVDVSYCSEPCASGSDLSHSQCGTLDNFIALNGTEYNIFGCVQAQVFSHAQGAT